MGCSDEARVINYFIDGIPLYPLLRSTFPKLEPALMKEGFDPVALGIDKGIMDHVRIKFDPNAKPIILSELEQQPANDDDFYGPEELKMAVGQQFQADMFASIQQGSKSRAGDKLSLVPPTLDTSKTSTNQNKSSNNASQTGDSNNNTPQVPVTPSVIPSQGYPNIADVGTNPGGAIGTFMENHRETRERVVAFTNQFNEYNSTLKLSNDFGHENIKFDLNENMIGWKGAMHAEKHGPHDVNDVVYFMSCMNDANPRGFLAHSITHTADAFIAMRITAIEQSEAKRSAELHKVNAKMVELNRELTVNELKKYTVKTTFSSKEFSPLNQAIMERDGWGSTYGLPRGQGEISVYENVKGFRAFYVPQFDSSVNEYIMVENTVYPDDRVHEASFSSLCVESYRMPLADINL
jgi:hypothetical protein